jgi:hypothetical protein
MAGRLSGHAARYVRATRPEKIVALPCACDGSHSTRASDRLHWLTLNRTQRLTAVNNTNYGPTGLPTIRSVITIAGNGSTIRRDPGAPEFRIFAVSSSGSLTLQRTTVSGGRLTSNNGAGITSQGAVTLTHSTITGNSSEDVIGGVFDALGGGPLSVTNSTISGNFAYSSGSTLLGLHNRSASLTSTTPEPSCRGK